jgi:hypothetical protein
MTALESRTDPAPESDLAPDAMEHQEAYEIYRAQGASMIDAAWAAVHGPAPARLHATPEPEPELEAEL